MNNSQRALAAAALFWFALNALSTNFVPVINEFALSSSVSWVPVALLALMASNPSNS
jgi:hypothetical protein